MTVLLVDEYRDVVENLPALMDRWEQLTDLMKEFYREGLIAVMAHRANLKDPELAALDSALMAQKDQIATVMGIDIASKLEATNG